MSAMGRVIICVVAVVLAASVALAQTGSTKGQVVTVGEDRIVVAAEGGGQMTFEVARVRDGDQWVANRAQVAQIKTLKAGDKVDIAWRQGDGGHYFIVEIKAGAAAAPQQRSGAVAGKVVTTGEGRVVIALEDGSQMTLEPRWIRGRNNQWGRDLDQQLFAQSLKAGDEVVALWQLDEGTHYITRGIAKASEGGFSQAMTQAQLFETQALLNQLMDRINQLQNQIQQLNKPRPE